MKKRILLYIEFDATRNIIVQNLKKHDYSIYECRDFESAKSAIYQNTVDLLIIDNDNSKDNSYKFLKLFRDHNLYMFTPVFLLATGSSEKHMELKEEFKIALVLPKPFDFRSLFNALEKLR